MSNHPNKVSKTDVSDNVKNTTFLLKRSQGTDAENTVRKRRRKIKSTPCQVENCNGRVVAILGECKWCSGHYCQFHRLPESHSCKNIESCKQSAKGINKQQVLNGICVARKVDII